MMERLRLSLAATVTLSGVLACGGLTPAPSSPAPITTMVAATIRAITAQAPTAGPMAPTPTATLPAALPTATALPATRISFQNGATTGVVSAPIAAGQALSYVLQGSQGQPMLVHVDSPQNDVTISIRTQGGTSLLAASAEQSSWKGNLPQTEDYVLTVYGG